MLRMGDARPSISAEAKVHEIIDRALNVQKPCDSGHEVAEVIGVAMSIDRRGLTVCVVPWQRTKTQKGKARRLSGFSMSQGQRRACLFCRADLRGLYTAFGL